MFELRDLPNYETLAEFAQRYGNQDIDGLQTWLILASATSEMLSAFERNLARDGLSQTQFFVLLLLKRNPGGLSVGTLADGVAVTSQTMTRVLDRMEAAGMCTKLANPGDRRAWIIQLASVGEELLSTALPSHYEWVTRLMSRFDAKERESLQKLMRKLNGPSALSPEPGAG
jgi:DNA-binding MarR family transcriptional regulator